MFMNLAIGKLISLMGFYEKRACMSRSIGQRMAGKDH